MVKNHLKKIASPKSWHIERKESVFITRPKPGAHPMKHSTSLSMVLRELIKFAKSAKDAKRIIKTKDVFVDKKKRSDPRCPTGIMDIIEFPQIEEHYRILLDPKGRLVAVKANAKEANTKLSRIESKTKIKEGKTQLNMLDGRNIIVDKDTYKTGDTLQISLPDQKITDHLKLEEGNTVLLIGGKHAGAVAKIEDVMNNELIIKAAKNQKFKAQKKHTFVVGKDKPALDSIKQASAQNR